MLALAAAAVLAAGGVAVAAANGPGASSADGSSRTAGQAPSGLGGGPSDRADGDAARGPGGLAGEQHIQGILTAKTANTISVKSSSGTVATYGITSSTEVARNGANATLAAVKVGDPVLVHVLPTSTSGHPDVERLFVGTLPEGGFGPGGGTPRGDDTSDA
jgi:hypothetical protein